MPISTGQFTLCAGFYGKTEVMKLMWDQSSVSSAALGAWIMLGSYDTAYPGHPIPYGARRLCGAKPGDIKRLVAHGFLIDLGGAWELGYGGHLWTITYGRSGYRAAIPHLVRELVFQRDGSRCVFCFATEDLTLDHITPWSHGGPDTVDNLRVLCRSCNSARGNRVEEALSGAIDR